MVLSLAPRTLALEAHVGPAKIYSARAPIKSLKMAFYLSQLCFYNHPNQMTIMTVNQNPDLGHLLCGTLVLTTRVLDSPTNHPIHFPPSDEGDKQLCAY